MTTVKLLSICRDGGMLLLRNSVLKSVGHTVISVEGLESALATLDGDTFDVVIVGHLYTTEEKNTIAEKAKLRGAKVLCMYSEAVRPAVSSADLFIHNLENPAELLAAIQALLNRPNARGTGRA